MSPDANVPHLLRWAIGLGVGGLVVWWVWRVSALDEARHSWVVWAVLITGVLLAEALPEVMKALPEPGLLTGTLVLSLAAVYGCVPETNHIYGIAVVLIAVGVIEVLTRQTMPIAWHAIAATLVLWSAMFGAAGRQRAFVGGLFAFWPVILLGFVATVVPSIVRSHIVARVLIAALGGGGAIVVARTGALELGRKPAARDAAVVVAVTTVASLVIALVSRARPRHRAR